MTWEMPVGCQGFIIILEDGFGTDQINQGNWIYDPRYIWRFEEVIGRRGSEKLSTQDPGEGCQISGLIKSQCLNESASLD